MQVQRILIPTDFSPAARHAFDWALSFARPYAATLHLLHVMADVNSAWAGSDDVLVQAGPPQERLEEEARAELKQLAEAAERHDLATHCTVRFSLDVADTILEEADAIDADLIATGTHGRQGLSRLLLGSVAQKVVRRARRPVLTVRAQAPEAPAIRRVLVPIDFSEPSKQALRFAKDVAHGFEAQLDLLFVAEARTIPVFSDTGLPHLGTVKMDPEIVREAGRGLEQLSDQVGGPPVSTHPHVAEGDVPDQILDFAGTHEVDLIVMATRGLAGLDRLLIGSVTQRVVRAAPCPVLTLNVHEGEERGGTGAGERG